MKPVYDGGANIAIKVPDHQFESTVAFYRDVLGLYAMETEGPSVSFRFGHNRLWLDPMPTEDTVAAARHLDDQRVVRRPGVEPIPETVDGFWVSDPCGNILLIHRSGT